MDEYYNKLKNKYFEHGPFYLDLSTGELFLQSTEDINRYYNIDIFCAPTPKIICRDKIRGEWINLIVLRFLIFISWGHSIYLKKIEVIKSSMKVQTLPLVKSPLWVSDIPSFKKVTTIIKYISKVSLRKGGKEFNNLLSFLDSSLLPSLKLFFTFKRRNEKQVKGAGTWGMKKCNL